MVLQIFDGADVDFVVKKEKTGKRVNGKCVAGKGRRPRRQVERLHEDVDVPGGFFKFIVISGSNEFRFSGRVADKPLPRAIYRLVAKAEGTAARSSYTRFKILK